MFLYACICIQLNIQRAKERRKPEFIESLQQPFDPNRFNFTKVKSGEIIGTLKFNEGQSSPEANDLSRVRNILIL